MSPARPTDQAYAHAAMTDNPIDLPGEASKAREELDRLTGQVAAMRAVLTRLLQEVVCAEAQLAHIEPKRLQEANEQLVISALTALAEVDRAHDERDKAARVGGTDQLTGLPNRTLLLDRLEAAISHAKRHGNRVALLFLDLNGFKRINDVLSHAAGDRALQIVAERLTSLVRETDTVSRHGGDEFLILLAEVAAATDAAHVAFKVNAVLRDITRIDNHRVHLTASIGISVYPDDGVDAQTLIDRADVAMYRAKKQEMDGFVLHHEPPLSHATSDQPVRPQSGSQTRPMREIFDHEERHEPLREANEQLVLAALGAQELLAAAEEARRRQAHLLTLVAEELRDPFGPIRVAAAALGQSGATEAVLPRVQELIEQGVGKLSRLVVDLLDSPLPEEVATPMLRQSFDPAQPIADCAADSRLALERRQQTLEVMPWRTQPMSGDPASLKRLLATLLFHTSMCTDRGGWIRLHVEMVTGSLLLTVASGGRGLVQSTAALPFNPFVLDPHPGVVSAELIALGLQAMRDAVEPHGVSVVAEIGLDRHGIEFAVSLPDGW